MRLASIAMGVLMCGAQALGQIEEAERLNVAGNDLGRSGKYVEAIPKYTHAIQIAPTYKEPWYNRGKARLNTGDYTNAVADFSRALELYTDSEGLADVYNNRGITKKKMGDIKGAIEDYTKAIEKNPKIYRAIVNRGIAYYDLGETDLAIKDFKTARDNGEKQGTEALRQLGIK